MSSLPLLRCQNSQKQQAGLDDESEWTIFVKNIFVWEIFHVVSG